MTSQTRSSSSDFVKPSNTLQRIRDPPSINVVVPDAPFSKLTYNDISAFISPSQNLGVGESRYRKSEGEARQDAWSAEKIARTHCPQSLCTGRMSPIGCESFTDQLLVVMPGVIWRDVCMVEGRLLALIGGCFNELGHPLGLSYPLQQGGRGFLLSWPGRFCMVQPDNYVSDRVQSRLKARLGLDMSLQVFAASPGFNRS